VPTILLIGCGPAAPGAGPSDGSDLLLESPADSFLLLESGDYLLLE